MYRLREMEPEDENVSGTVAIVSSYVPSPKTALEFMDVNFGDEVKYITFGTEFSAGIRHSLNGDETPQSQILGMIAETANLVVVTPKIQMLSKIAEGDDSGFIEHLIMRALLWGRKVTLLLDFTPPRFRRNTFYEKVVTVIETLRDMGITVRSYNVKEEDDDKGLSLVTEREIEEAFGNKKTSVKTKAGAIITPLARDKARELDIKIN